VNEGGKHVVLGTAGHIDHGKTELIRALTGVDTDRLSEEKERGISIELGFAPFRLPSGITVGVVDVPGHERFVKTMLAGVGGIDVMLLVVAADEGVMPQTREHMDIVDLLGIQTGLVALTKTDLAAEEEIELAQDDVLHLLAGTVLEGAPIIPVSSVTKEGLPSLVTRLDEIVQGIRARSAEGPARLPVDRVFSLAGHGTIVTGTLWSGTVAAGDKLEVYPGGGTAVVRSVQVHDHAVEEAVAGQRTALGLRGVAKSDLSRGDTLGEPGALNVTHMIDARLRLVSGAKPMRNRTRLHFHLGTAEVLARVVLLEGETLDPGGDALVQMRLESPVAALAEDPFVIRSYSPVTTIGGGRVIDPTPARHGRMRDDVLEAIEILESGGEDEVVAHLVGTSGFEGMTEAELSGRTAGASPEIVASLLADGRLVRVAGKLITAQGYDGLKDSIKERLDAFAANAPLEWGMSAEELRGKLGKRLERAVLDAALADLERDRKIARKGGLVRWGGADVALSAEQEKLAVEIESKLKHSGANPPTLDDLRSELGGGEFDAIVKLMAAGGRVVKVTTSMFFHPDIMGQIRKAVLAHFETEQELTVPRFKDLVGVTRKYAIPLLEYFDREGVTTRSGNIRVKGARAE
jgi:selenocysteine-specific elongation factor